MAGKKRYRDFNYFPKYKQMYINAFDRMLKSPKSSFKKSKTGEDVFKWWMGENPDQIKLEGFE